MTLSIVPWMLLAAFVLSLIVGCVEWFKGRGGYMVLAALPNLALVAAMLVGDGYPWISYTCLAIGMVLVIYTLISLRKKIRWLSLPILSGAATCLLLVAPELLTTFIPAIPKAVVRTMVNAMAVSAVVFFASLIWDLVREIRRAYAAGTRTQAPR